MLGDLKKVIWAGMPGGVCNLQCQYCYTGARKGKQGQCLYSVEHMLKCFHQARFGGPIFFGGASGGETLFWNGIVDFTRGMLAQGHIVSYTTNMTMSKVIRSFCEFDPELRQRLQLDASLHYLELKREKLLPVFFENLRRIGQAGISYAIFICISDAYIPYLEEIHNVCKKETGILPVAGMVREYSYDGVHRTMTYSSDIDDLVHRTCDARQWDLQKRVYGQHRAEKCYAGALSFNLDLESGTYTKCWGKSKTIGVGERFLNHCPSLLQRAGAKLKLTISHHKGNIFDDPSTPIIFEPMGDCPFPDCVCASYLCWGLVPGFDVPTHSRVFFHRSAVSQTIWTQMDKKLMIDES